MKKAEGEPMVQALTERRKAARRQEETLVRFEGENFSIYSRATDISNQGAFVATHYLLDPGTPISLHVIDAAGQESQTSARVVRAISKTDEQGEEVVVGLGVEFTS